MIFEPEILIFTHILWRTNMKRLLLLFSIILFGCSNQPKVNDWYEKIETKERFKVDFAGTTLELRAKYRDYMKRIDSTWALIQNPPKTGDALKDYEISSNYESMKSWYEVQYYEWIHNSTTTKGYVVLSNSKTYDSLLSIGDFEKNFRRVE